MATRKVNKPSRKQQIKCDGCKQVAFERPMDWIRKAHCKNVFCAACTAHKVTRG